MTVSLSANIPAGVVFQFFKMFFNVAVWIFCREKTQPYDSCDSLISSSMSPWYITVEMLAHSAARTSNTTRPRAKINQPFRVLRSCDCWLTCQSDGAAVHAPPEARLVTEWRRPVSLAVTVLVVVAHLQYIKKGQLSVRWAENAAAGLSFPHAYTWVFAKHCAALSMQPGRSPGYSAHTRKVINELCSRNWMQTWVTTARSPAVFIMDSSTDYFCT